jgi:hypothetical protein
MKQGLSRTRKKRTSCFQEAVAKGVQAIERGETFALTPDLLQAVKQDAIRKARYGEPYSSTDAIPENTQVGVTPPTRKTRC